MMGRWKKKEVLGGKSETGKSKRKVDGGRKEKWR